MGFCDENFGCKNIVSDDEVDYKFSLFLKSVRSVGFFLENIFYPTDVMNP